MTLLVPFLVRDWRIATSHRVPFLFDALALLGSVALFFYLGRYVGSTGSGSRLFDYTVAGLVVLRVQGALPRIMQLTEAEIASGNLQLLLTSPLSIGRVMFSEAAFELLRSAVFGAFLLLVSVTLFGAPFHVGVVGAAAIVVAFAGAGALFLGVAFLAIGILFFVRQGAALATLATIAIPVVAGAYFPVGSLPQPLRAVSLALPFRLPVDVMRAGLRHDRFDAAAAGWLVLGSAALIAVALVVVHAGVEHSRRNGTLGRP